MSINRNVYLCILCIFASARCHKNKIFGKYVYKYIIILESKKLPKNFKLILIFR